jgi:hypothetical protein
MAKLYALFGPGVFRLADRLHCERKCLWASLSHYYPSLARLLGRAVALARTAVASPLARIPSTNLQQPG